MDWVPVHFCKDAHGLIDFDGKPLYEYPFDDLKENHQWGTRQFDLGNFAVRQFLISSVNFWAEYYHLDGVRVDAVSYMIYYLGDTSRGISESGVEFLRTFNTEVHKMFPGFVTIAEDSSAYPKVTEPVFNGGLGFDFKWDLGWMNDVLKFMGQSYEDRTINHNPLTFGMMYRYSDKYILPFSHDEVVHGKGSLVNKMYGTYEEKFSNLRMLYGYMYAYPSKILNFMGNEIAQFSEWDEAKQVEWEMKKYPLHDSVARYVRDLNIVYKFNEALFSKDCDPDGFVWSEVHKPHDGIYVFIRRGHLAKDLVVICNFSDKDFYDYRFGVLQDGGYNEIINSDAAIYGGSGMVNAETIFTEKVDMNGKEDSIKIHIPKLSTIYLLKE
jgi:1,4-alpha-glucan branching enzyme